VGGELAASLPTVGREGTVQYVGAKTPAAGRCIAKTGTLDYVTNLAGYCRTRDDHMLAFALMFDGPANGTATVLEGKIVGAIAGY
jgi:D-alanyl-D-alanine carboxypeptidase/D-alanyl-D-alanine-endopeptidase (penicillin-binding protein 4)